MKFRKAFVWSCMLLLGRGYAQEQAQQQAQQQAQSPTGTAPKPAEKSQYTSDGVGSVTLYYWRAPAHPMVGTGRGILVSGAPAGRVEQPGEKPYLPGVEIGIPAKENTIRLSYFRVQAGGTTTPANDLTLNASTYYGGDLLSASYTLQAAKLSFDYISWEFPLEKPKFRLKTLWELQYIGVKSGFDVPNQVMAGSKGSDWLLLPTLGMGLEHMVSKHFRWEAKASGFGFPRRSVVWDAEAYGAVRLGKAELMIGGKAFHFKTSPAKEQYVSATLPGAFIGLRWYP